MKKKTKLLVISSLFAVTGIGVTVAAAGGFNDALGGVLPAKAGQHDSTHTLKEKAYEAPTYTKEGFKPYYLCEECCEYGPEEARFSYEDKTTHAALSDIRMEPLTEASVNDVAEGDMISTINTQKFKYVDQGANGVDGVEGESTPVYTKDGDKTALFFSRSGKTGEPYNASGNTNCSEFRFSISGRSTISSATFNYRYLDYGKGTWTGGDNVGQPLGAHSIVQVKDGKTYYGKNVAFENDDQWHTITLNFADFETAGNKQSTTDFTNLIFKFIDLRGHIFISGLSFADAPVTVTLKNATADGTDLTENVAIGSMPTTVPTMEGKTFAGWYDESGNKVETIAGATTLIAKWKAEVDGFIGEKIYSFDVDNNELYGTPEGVEAKLNARGKNSIESDLTESWGYKEIYEEGSFVGIRSTNEFTGTVGVTFPAYDFSKNGPLTFDFGLSTGHDNNDDGQNSPFIVDGNDVGNDCDTKLGYTMTIHDQNASVYNKHLKKTYTFILSESVYKGETGLSFVSKSTQYRFFLCTPYKSLLVDYISKCESIEEEVPDSPINDADSIALVKEYQELRTLYTDTENSLYPMSEKMSNWIDALPKTVLRFEDNGRSLTTTGNLACSDSWINKAYTQNGLGRNVPFSLGEGYLIAGTDDLTKTYGSVTLPAFDFSAYKNVTFSFGQGGNGGGTKARYFLGSVDNATSYEDSLNLPNYLGEATSTNTIGWNLAEDIKATISNGKITFKGNESTIDKTLDLDNDIYTGQKGLTLTLSNVTWEFFVLSPFTASNI
ncbi:MAG TPA: hypothetical protein DD377_01890 [Firmicutes bacterium]|nr:hypothetical protein [Bacillota bacterium]